jgi:hypothetical protein
MMQVHVRVDAARHDDMSLRLDGSFCGLSRQRADSRDRSDCLADNRDIAADDTPGRHHVAAPNDEIKHHASCRRDGSSACLTQALIHAVVCTENSDSDVVVMQSTEEGV